MDLAFERTIQALERRAAVLAAAAERDPAAAAELVSARAALDAERARVFAALTPIERLALARHPRRPYPLDYVAALVERFVELHGDRREADDAAVAAGFGVFRSRPVAVIALQKGRSVREKVQRNFGRPRPAGARKARRAIELAARAARPVLAFVDAAGAAADGAAEGAEAAAALGELLFAAAVAPTPFVSVVTGESSGAWATPWLVADRVAMQAYAVMAPAVEERAAEVLFGSARRLPSAVRAMRLSAEDAARAGVVDVVVPEPPGAAHADPAAAAALLGDVLERELDALEARGAVDPDARRARLNRMVGVTTSFA